MTLNMDLKALKKEVYEQNLELVSRGLVIYTWGNVSAIDRENNLVVIKPKGLEYDDLTADDMSVVDMDGNLIEGLLPSVDLDIHLEIYKPSRKSAASPIPTAHGRRPGLRPARVSPSWEPPMRTTSTEKCPASVS